MSRQSGPADTDAEPATFVRGPGRRRRSAPGPVYDAYAVNGAINRTCPTCQALPMQYCQGPNGALRKSPCQKRLSERQDS